MWFNQLRQVRPLAMNCLVMAIMCSITLHHTHHKLCRAYNALHRPAWAIKVVIDLETAEYAALLPCCGCSSVQTANSINYTSWMVKLCPDLHTLAVWWNSRCDACPTSTLCSIETHT